MGFGESVKQLDEIRDQLDTLIYGTFVESPKPQFLYHYTDLESARSIIEKGQLWVSDAFTTNDEKEVIHSRDLIKDWMCCDSPNRNPEVTDLCLFAFDRVVELIKDKVFILCFSLSKSSNPLWECYARKGNKTGVCMRFDYDTIRPNPVVEYRYQKRVFQDESGQDIELDSRVLDHLVIYSDAEKQAIVGKYLQLAYDVIEHIEINLITQTDSDTALAVLQDIFTDIILFSLISKDSSWEAEEEYRMVFMLYGTDQFNSIIKLRKRETLDVRYVSLNMIADNTFSLSRIYVETMEDQCKVKRSLKRLLPKNVRVKVK